MGRHLEAVRKAEGVLYKILSENFIMLLLSKLLF